MWRAVLVMVVAWLAAAAVPMHAQVAAAEMTGLVKDQAGATVRGATVTVTDVNTNRQRVVTSSAQGLYAVPSLAPGDYRVDVELTGFRSVRRAKSQCSSSPRKLKERP